MYHHAARDERLRSHVNVSGQCNVACNDGPVPNVTIVSDVAIGHEETISTQSGNTALLSTAMHCSVLANHGLVADFRETLDRSIFQILGVHLRERLPRRSLRPSLNAGLA